MTYQPTGTYVLRIANSEQWYAILDGVEIDATFNSKGAAYAGIEVERRRRLISFPAKPSQAAIAAFAKSLDSRPGADQEIAEYVRLFAEPGADAWEDRNAE